jgi:hypothetical protein
VSLESGLGDNFVFVLLHELVDFEKDLLHFALGLPDLNALLGVVAQVPQAIIHFGNKFDHV